MSSSSIRRTPLSHPVYSEFPAANFVTASGVAIFHLKTAHVVLCYHTRDKYWFLPKGRRDAGEDSRRAAQREGFEESGYRNRLLPLPIQHRQPQPHNRPDEDAVTNVIEPVWTSLLPNSKRTQYLLHWYISETLPPEDETSLSSSSSRNYADPPPYPPNLTLAERMDLEDDGYEPMRYEGTGVDEEEALYTSELVPVEEALRRLGRNSMADVVAIGWERIQARMRHEEEPRTIPAVLK